MRRGLTILLIAEALSALLCVAIGVAAGFSAIKIVLTVTPLIVLQSLGYGALLVIVRNARITGNTDEVTHG
jgi:hypothetical protein